MRSLVTSTLVLAVLPALGLENATVNRPVANLYSRPTEDTDVVSQAIYGTAVVVLESRGAWRKIRTPDEYHGWIPAAALAATSRPYAKAGTVARVDSLFAHLYREPSVTRHAPLLTVPFETQLEIVAEPADNERRWLQVRLVDDRPAWVQRGDLTFDHSPLTIERVIALGKRFLGLPYTWGGTSSFGYDCSGFTQMLCRRRGILLPRDADQQAFASNNLPVDKNDLRAGDLLYFGKSLKSITHTGLYIGDGEFLHASVNGQPVVQISRLSDEPWHTLLIAQRRPR